MRSCWVIEAQGKIPFFRKNIPKKDIVVATFGYLYSMPKTLWPLSIDKLFNEHGLSVVRQENIDRIHNYLSKVDEVIIATDDDQEGDLIASDVYRIAKELNKNCSRVRLCELSKEAILESLNSKVKVDVRLERPAIRRRIVDRIIGSVFSNKLNNTYCGRVMTPLLVGAGDPDNLIIETDMHKPWSAGDCLYHVSGALGVSPIDVSSSMQKLYENGQLSYPRSDIRNVSPSAVVNIYASAKMAGMTSRFSMSAVKNTGAHPSPYPIGPVDIMKSTDVLSKDEAVLSVIAKKWVSVATGGYLKINIKEVTDEMKLIAVMMNLDIGRPSTFASISSKLVRNGLFLNGGLTEKGKKWVQAAPVFLSNPKYAEILKTMVSPDAPLELLFKKMGKYKDMEHLFCSVKEQSNATQEVQNLSAKREVFGDAVEPDSVKEIHIEHDKLLYD